MHLLAPTLLLGLTACAHARVANEAPPPEGYGPSQALRGIAVNGFEVDAVSLCDDDRAQCIAADTGSAQDACWNEWTPAANKQLMTLTDGQAYAKYDYSRYWMQFTGRKTRGDGQYGHLGVYPCKVLVEGVTVYELLVKR